jgi:prephenate dehydrogenase
MDKTVILIVGLGQIGTSIGLALGKHSDMLHRIGHTRIYGQGNQAKKMGALDKSAANLPSAARKANIVVLALPMDEVKDALELIAPELKEGAVVLDCSPARQAASDWATDVLPEGRYYVGFTPVLNPKNLHITEGGINAANELLFQDGMFAITSPMGTSSDALKVAGDLATMMEAVPLFADIVEIDSYMASVHVLPQLLAAGVANITMESPGWDENRKLTGRPYAQLTNLIASLDRANAIALSARLNKEHVVRSIDDLIAELQAMRAELDEGDDGAFDARINLAGDNQRRWWQERKMVQWLSEGGEGIDMTQIGSSFGQLFGYGKPRPERGKRKQ